MVEGAHVSLRVPETSGRALGGGAKWRARVCQGGTLLTGAPAAASGRGGGEPGGVRGARYSSGPSIGRAGSGRAHRPPAPMRRHAPRRRRGPGGRSPDGRAGPEKVDPPEKASNSTWGNRM